MAAYLMLRTKIGYALKGYGTVRDVEDTEKAGEKPVQDCIIADCGQLPADTDLASSPTFTAQVQAHSKELTVLCSVRAL